MNNFSGIWTGFYKEPHQPNKGWMHLNLEFQNEIVRGEGTDYVGPWVINGCYSDQDKTASWTKQYLGKHSVAYLGQISKNGIAGTWKISDWLTGEFHIWPANRYDLYLQNSDDR